MNNALESETLWNITARDTLRKEMRKKKVSLGELARRLNELGVSETKASIANKISRGTFSARFMLQVLHVLDSKTIPLSGLPSQESQEIGGRLIKEPEWNMGTTNFSWEENHEFKFNSFDQEWYIKVGEKDESSGKGFNVVSLFTGAGGLDLG